FLCFLSVRRNILLLKLILNLLLNTLFWSQRATCRQSSNSLFEFLFSSIFFLSCIFNRSLHAALFLFINKTFCVLLLKFCNSIIIGFQLPIMVFGFVSHMIQTMKLIVKKYSKLFFQFYSCRGFIK